MEKNLKSNGQPKHFYEKEKKRYRDGLRSGE